MRLRSRSRSRSRIRRCRGSRSLWFNTKKAEKILKSLNSLTKSQKVYESLAKSAQNLSSFIKSNKVRIISRSDVHPLTQPQATAAGTHHTDTFHYTLFAVCNFCFFCGAEIAALWSPVVHHLCVGYIFFFIFCILSASAMCDAWLLHNRKYEIMDKHERFVQLPHRRPMAVFSCFCPHNYRQLNES